MTVARFRFLWKPRPVPSAARDIVIVLACSWFVRAVVILTWPRSAHSDDLDSWMTVARELRRGANPYVTTSIVKWPPFAVILVWLVDHAARALDVAFFTAMRVTLIAAESALVVVLYLLLTYFAPRAEVRRLLIAGISLNPIAILLVCQHENIDVFVGLCVGLALWALVAYDRTGDGIAWLAACLAVGLGVFTKTVPIVLAPLLVPGFRTATRLGRTLGLSLFLGPAVLGVGIVYVLAPHAVAENVFGYRSIRGYFGVTGLLRLAGRDGLGGTYDRLFAVLLAVCVCALVVVAWRRGLTATRAILLAGLLMALLPALGPGYGPQYAYWYIPPLLASFLLLDATWRKILLAGYAVAAVTYVIEYAFIPALGRFLVEFAPDSLFFQRVSAHVSSPGEVTILRMPLFAAFLVVLVAGIRRLRETPTA